MDELEKQYDEHMRNCNRWIDMIRRSHDKFGDNAVANTYAQKLVEEQRKLDEVAEKILTQPPQEQE